ncbi:hypothetical protein F4781DRAFT_414805 [Annulohypoxylon bovei var. microspora]|nr:hypothetical protein F4781DRAFT_414805 [Annulohypoxylon bovei var. microspora]
MFTRPVPKLRCNRLPDPRSSQRRDDQVRDKRQGFNTANRKLHLNTICFNPTATTAKNKSTQQARAKDLDCSPPRKARTEICKMKFRTKDVHGNGPSVPILAFQHPVLLGFRDILELLSVSAAYRHQTAKQGCMRFNAVLQYLPMQERRQATNRILDAHPIPTCRGEDAEPLDGSYIHVGSLVPPKNANDYKNLETLSQIPLVLYRNAPGIPAHLYLYVQP